MDNTEPSYSLIIRNRTPSVKADEMVEIEGYLSGYGFPQYNKLVIQWSSPYVVDRNNPGSFITNVSLAINSETKEIVGVATGRNYIDAKPVDQTGITLLLHKGFFMTNPNEEPNPEVDYKLPQIVSELAWDGQSPLFLRMNTSQQSSAGDYDVSFIFTYGNERLLKQGFKTVSFHILSWWERNEWWVVLSAGIIALVSLILSTIFSVLTYNKP
ncbi:MAG: hypothetical protein AMJ70_04400 [Dehalococcoidia bacterium SG8_51_3]|nr:MAG: hypothetical protein AMJ70_04400 [Dehalococcoidia bacterium SG8_51_3]